MLYPNIMGSASLRILQWSLERSLDVSDGLWEKPMRLPRCERWVTISGATINAHGDQPHNLRRDQSLCSWRHAVCNAINVAIGGTIMRSRRRDRFCLTRNENVICSTINVAISGEIIMIIAINKTIGNTIYGKTSHSMSKFMSSQMSCN